MKKNGSALIELILGVFGAVGMMVAMACGFGLAVGVYQVSKCWITTCS